MLLHIVIDIDPFAIHFPAGWWVEGIRWYGVCYVVSFFLVQFFLAFYSRKGLSPLSSEENEALLIYFALGAVMGGRLGYCLLYDFDNFSTNPLIFFQIWRGGMASHGGFAGGILAILYFSWRYRRDRYRVGDVVSSIIPLCLMVGRLGNFVNGELLGRETAVPWGVIFVRDGVLGLVARHPSPLYEAFFEGFLPFIILQILIYRRCCIGYLGGIFLVLYAIGRIGCEFFREPDAGLILGLTRGQFYSLFLLFLGIFLIIFVSRRRRGIRLGPPDN
ncbi:MAG: prolipoprotein diacylglyceryl transferase [Puniceicoccales bacterium]|jgi:phosphatidylglycerol:prolipoprotein diacylglycerol transferase|nr:prolipoprotein diacylglyceryl transferase [Puniceicoccales bacterium]